MQVCRVGIWNYRSIENAIFRPGSITLLVGQNSSGKSNIIHALDLFFNGKPTAEATDCIRRTERGHARSCTVRVTFDDLPPSLWRDIDQTLGKPAPRRPLPLTVRYFDGDRYVEVPPLADENTPEAKAIERLLLSRMTFVRIPPIRDAERDLSLAEGSVLRRILEITYRPSARGRPRAFFRTFAQAFSDVVTELAGISRDVENITREMMQFESVQFTPRQASLTDLFAGMDVSVRDPVETSLTSKGTGFQSAFLIGVMRYLAQKARTDPTIDLLLAVEEPEAFLHPNAQRALWRALEQLSQASQMILTTHSPVLVDRVKWTDFSSVIRVSRTSRSSGHTPVTKVHQPSLTDQQRQVISHRTDLNGSEVFFAEGVVIVEGPGDRLVYVELATKQSRMLEHDGIVVLESRGSSFEPAISLCSAYGIPWVVLCDKDKLRGQRPLLDHLQRYAGAPPSTSTRVRQLAAAPVANRNDATLIAKRINSLLKSYRCQILECDLEYSLVNAGSIQRVITVLRDRNVLGLSPSIIRSWRELETRNINALVAEVSSYIGSRGLAGKRRQNPPGKKSHIPIRIAEALPLDLYSTDLVKSLEFARRALLVSPRT